MSEEINILPYINEIKERLQFRLTTEFKEHDLIQLICDDQFSRIETKVESLQSQLTKEREENERLRETVRLWESDAKINGDQHQLSYELIEALQCEKKG